MIFSLYLTLLTVFQLNLELHFHINNFKGLGCTETPEIQNGLFECDIEKANGTYPSDTKCQATCNNELDLTGKPGSVIICEDDTWEPPVNQNICFKTCADLTQLTKIKFKCVSSKGSVVPTNGVTDQTVCKPSCDGGRVSEEDYQLKCVVENADAIYKAGFV